MSGPSASTVATIATSHVLRTVSGGSIFAAGFGSNTQADARTRTADPFITSEVLYQLSYVGAGS